MPVLIHDFEVLPDTQPAPRGGASESREGASPRKLEPRDVAAALRVLDRQALRTWAH